MSVGPGRLLGEGRTAEVFEFGDGKVVKLLRPGFSEASLRDEALKTASAVASGAPAPAVHGFEEIEGRLGVVFDRAEGDLLIDLILAAPHRALNWGRILAGVHAELLGHTSDVLPDVREALAEKISHAQGLTGPERAAAKDALALVPDGNSVLHGDFHALNVYLSGDRATVIDWRDAARGPIEADIVRSMWLTSTHVIPPDFPHRRAVLPLASLLGRSYRRRILALTGLTASDLDGWRLPVVAARLSEGIGHEEPALTAEVRRLIARLSKR